jgi:hypothetical protein
MRGPLSRSDLEEFMTALARSSSRGSPGNVYLVGGGTAVWLGWRASTIDVDLHGEPECLFADIQRIKEALDLNVEFARPEDFVPALAGTGDRHVFIERIGRVSFYHHDPYAQTFSKIVRGFDRDLRDAERFISSGMVDADRLRELIHQVPESTYAKYPALSRDAVLEAIDGFLAEMRSRDKPGLRG